METDLAAPVTAFLAAQGWTVRSEVKDCDVAAVRGDELLVVELKRSITLALLVQAARRQRLTDTVYLAVPRPASTWQWRRANRGVLHLLRRLELGLLWVAAGVGGDGGGDAGTVDVVLQPKPLARRRRPAARRAVLEEVGRRSADYNTAGSTRRRLVTAYREEALRIACFLAVHGELSPKRLRAMGTGAKTRSVLYDNVYGWFRRTGTARYRLSAHGARDIGAFPELAARFRAEAETAAVPVATARASSARAPAASQSRRGGVSSRRRGRT